jgi:hypothetical protein
VFTFNQPASGFFHFTAKRGWAGLVGTFNIAISSSSLEMYRAATPGSHTFLPCRLAFLPDHNDQAPHSTTAAAFKGHTSEKKHL